MSKRVKVLNLIYFKEKNYKNSFLEFKVHFKWVLQLAKSIKNLILKTVFFEYFKSSSLTVDFKLLNK